MVISNIYADLATQFIEADKALAKGLKLRTKPQQPATPFLDYQAEKRKAEAPPPAPSPDSNNAFLLALEKLGLGRQQPPSAVSDVRTPPFQIPQLGQPPNRVSVPFVFPKTEQERQANIGAFQTYRQGGGRLAFDLWRREAALKEAKVTGKPSEDVFRELAGQPTLADAKKLRQETYKKHTLLAQTIGGVGDVLKTGAGVAEWLGQPSIAKPIKEAGAALGQDVPDIEMPPLSLKSATDPKFWAAVPSFVARMTPFTLSLVPAMVAGYAGGGAVAGVLGLGALGRVILGSIGATVLSRPIESALEAGGTYNEAVTSGMSEEQAGTAAKSVFVKNLALGVGDIAQLGAAFLPTPLKVTNRYIRPLIVGGKVIGVGLSEAGEEALQDVFQKQALGKPVVLDEAMKQAMVGGAIFGAGMGGVGGVFTSIQNRIVENIPQTMQAKFDADVAEGIRQGLPRQQAVLWALDELAKTPQGKRLVETATRAVQKEDAEFQIAESVKRLQSIRAELVPEVPGKAAPESEVTRAIVGDTQIQGALSRAQTIKEKLFDFEMETIGRISDWTPRQEQFLTTQHKALDNELRSLETRLRILLGQPEPQRQVMKAEEARRLIATGAEVNDFNFIDITLRPKGMASYTPKDKIDVLVKDLSLTKGNISKILNERIGSLSKAKPAPVPGVTKPSSQYDLSQVARKQDIQGLREEGTLANYNLQSQQEWLGKGTRYAIPVPKDGKLTIYRATPTGEVISPGDYVTTSRLYAEEHIRSNLGGKGKITSIQVTLDDLAPADAPNEFWYVPEPGAIPKAEVGMPEVTKEIAKPRIADVSPEELVVEAKKYKSADEFAKEGGYGIRRVRLQDVTPDELGLLRKSGYNIYFKDLYTQYAEGIDYLGDDPSVSSTFPFGIFPEKYKEVKSIPSDLKAHKGKGYNPAFASITSFWKEVTKPEVAIPKAVPVPKVPAKGVAPVTPEVTLSQNEIKVLNAMPEAGRNITIEYISQRARLINPELDTALKSLRRKGFISHDKPKTYARLLADEFVPKAAITKAEPMFGETEAGLQPSMLPEENARIRKLSRVSAEPMVGEQVVAPAQQEAVTAKTQAQKVMAGEGVVPPREIPPERVIYGEGGSPVNPDDVIPQAVVEKIPILKDIGAKERVRPARKVLEKLGQYPLFKGIQRAEVELGEARVIFQKELKEVSRWVAKDRRGLVFDAIENPKNVVDLTDNEKRAVVWFRGNFDKWADKLNLPPSKRLNNYITHIFEVDITNQIKDGQPLDTAIARALEYRTPKTIFNPFLQERLGKKTGLIRDPFAAASAYEARELKVFYYEPMLQKIAAIANDEQTPDAARRYLQDYARRMTGEPSKLDLEINTTFQEFAEKIRGLPGGEALANAMSRGNPSGMASYNFTSALYTLWLGFKPTSAIRNLGQHTLILGEVGPVHFANGIKLRATQEGKAAMDESLVIRSRKAAFIPGIDDSFASEWVDKFRETALWMFRKADKQNVADAFLAGYSEAKSLLPKANRQVWIERGDEVAADTQYLYTKLNSMAISQSSLGRVFSMLTTWSENWIELMSKWVSRNPSQAYSQYERETGQKVTGANWSTSYKAILMYMAIIGLGFAIKERTRLKAWEYTGLTSINYLADVVGGDFPGLQYPGAVANVIAGFLAGDNRRMKEGWSQLNPVKMAGIARQIDNVASGRKDWLTLFFYLQDKNIKLKRLDSKWQKEPRYAAYFKIPAGDIEFEIAKKKDPTLISRTQYRARYPEVDAMLWITGQTTAFHSYSRNGVSVAPGVSYARKLIEENKIDPTTISGYQKVVNDIEKREKAGLKATGVLTPTEKFVKELMAKDTRTTAPTEAPVKAELTTNLQKLEAVLSSGGKPAIIAFNKIWYTGEQLTSEEDGLLKGLFKQYPFGETNYETWKKETMFRVYDNSVRER